MKVKTNPAGRLHDILSEARGQSDDKKTRAVWANAFGVDENDTGEILKMLADLIDLSHETKGALRRLDDIDHTLYLSPFKKIDKAFAQINLEAQWKAWKGNIDETTLASLRCASDKLGRVLGYTEIEEDTIRQIQSQTDELISNVVEAELPESVKLLLVRNLENLRRSLIAYRIRGIEGLEQEIEANFGSLLVHKEAIQNDPGDRSLWQKYLRLLDVMYRTVSVAKYAQELAPPTILMLENIVKGVS